MPMDDFEREYEEFRQLVATMPVQTVVGLVDPKGVMGAMGESDTSDLMMWLAAWRDESGVLHRDGLRIVLPVSKRKLDSYMEKIDAYSIIKIVGRIADHPRGGKDMAGSKLISYRVKDPELSVIAAEYKVPVKIVDPVLGKLVLDRQIGWFSGKAKWGGRKIEVNVDTDEGTLEQALQTAHLLFQQQELLAPKIEDFAVEELLDGVWLEKRGGAVVTAEEFKRRMKLKSVTIYPGGRYDFWHSDGGLFCGHEIEVCGDLENGPTSAHMAG